MNPLVSIIIPTKNSSKNLENCLESIKNQTYKNIETIIVIPEKDAEIERLSGKYGFILTYCDQGKNAARNYGSRKSQGEYLFHVDDDMKLSKEVIFECVELALKEKYKAIAVPEIEEKSKGLYNRIRILEKLIASSDINIEAPRFIKKDIFFQIGQIDARLDPIDEGDLKAKLEEKGIRYATTMANIILSSENRATFLISRWKHVYRRGQKMPLFNFLHPNSNQLKFTKRAKSYTQNISLLIKNNIAGAFLLVIKLLDFVMMKIGAINVSSQDKKIISDLKNKIIFEKEAGIYQKDFFENTIGAKYVDKAEKEIVEKYLKNINIKRNSRIKILDIGPGGGRWSQLMLNIFPYAEVIGYDLSEGMVSDLNNKFKNDLRFRAMVGDMQNMPFDDGEFDLVISIRALKYAQDQKKVFEEIVRILKPNSYAIIELPYFNLVYRLIKSVKIFGKLSEYANRIKLISQKKIISKIKSANLKILEKGIYFTVPATFYKKINSRFLLKTITLVDYFLPKKIFGRSLFLKLKKYENRH